MTSSLREYPVFSAQVSSFNRRFFSEGETRNLSRKNRRLLQARWHRDIRHFTDISWHLIDRRNFNPPQFLSIQAEITNLESFSIIWFLFFSFPFFLCFFPFLSFLQFLVGQKAANSCLRPFFHWIGIHWSDWSLKLLAMSTFSRWKCLATGF